MTENNKLSELSSIEDIVEDARNGKIFVLVDDENRENEGDLIVPAQMATPATINFMAKNGRGLICLALNNARAEALDLAPMDRRNTGSLDTAFTVSIEAKEGVTTGISAADSAKTIQVAIDPTTGPNDIRTPGHVFPLRAREGGVLTRAGHTEAAVDLARLAGLFPASDICEIMNEDGSMARLEDLRKFCFKHNLKIGTIADLIAWRVRNDPIIRKINETNLETDFAGNFDMHIYLNTVQPIEHIALVKGKVFQDKPTAVRVHAVDVISDVLSGNIRDIRTGKPGTIQNAMKEIDSIGNGVLVIIREANTLSLSERINNINQKEQENLKEYGVGPQILRDLGVRDMILLTRSQKLIVGLEGFDLRVVGHQSISSEKKI